MQNLTPADAISATMRRAEATVVVSTFSVNMCFPARAAAVMTCSCISVGALTTTASISEESASSRRAHQRTPSASASCFPRSGSSSQTAAIRAIPDWATSLAYPFA